jgi:hypothetical protein
MDKPAFYAFLVSLVVRIEIQDLDPFKHPGSDCINHNKSFNFSKHGITFSSRKAGYLYVNFNKKRTSIAELVHFCAAPVPAPACQKFRLQLGTFSPYNKKKKFNDFHGFKKFSPFNKKKIQRFSWFQKIFMFL